MLALIRIAALIASMRSGPDMLPSDPSPAEWRSLTREIQRAHRLHPKGVLLPQ